MFTLHPMAMQGSKLRAFKPDLVILDAMLPGIDGIELLSRLRRESDVYVIMLTARIKETDRIKVMKEELSKMGAKISETEAAGHHPAHMLEGKVRRESTPAQYGCDPRSLRQLLPGS